MLVWVAYNRQRLSEGEKERIKKELGSAVAFEYILHVFVRLTDRKAFVLRWHIERVVS